MLTQIYVKDFVLIDQVRLDFDAHMSAFTGETGAGKSILMDAIGILKGDRINASMVKEGKSKAIVEGVFSLRENHIAFSMLEEAGFEMEDDTLIVTREFSKEGKSIARINQRTVTASFLKDVVSSLVDIHSQHDTQYLLNAKYHLSLLDNFCNHEQLCKTVKECYTQYKKIADDLEAALHQDYNEDDLEFLTFQLNEIEEAALQEGELEELEQEQRQLMAFEKINAKVNLTYGYLEDEGRGLAAVYDACKEISSIHEDDFFAGVHDKMLEAYYLIDEQLQQIKDHMNTLEYDEEHFHELQERIFLIHKILRKYGPNRKAVQEKHDELERKIDSILHRQDFVIKQEKIRDEAKTAFLNVANKLHEQRMEKATQLEALVLSQLKDLQLPNAKFHVEIETVTGTSNGIDKVAFFISMNPGEPLKPLSTTASGGELSRFMLGLKTVFTALQGIDTIIFDEIDTGVSGSVALSIGQKMKELAMDTQVFCVTHLAAVAACADYHYIVEKTQLENTTKTNIRLLKEEERLKELAAISSSSSSPAAMDAAKELYLKAQGK